MIYVRIMLCVFTFPRACRGKVITHLAKYRIEQQHVEVAWGCFFAFPRQCRGKALNIYEGVVHHWWSQAGSFCTIPRHWWWKTLNICVPLRARTMYMCQNTRKNAYVWDNAWGRVRLFFRFRRTLSRESAIYIYIYEGGHIQNRLKSSPTGLVAALAARTAQNCLNSTSQG